MLTKLSDRSMRSDINHAIPFEYEDIVFELMLIKNHLEFSKAKGFQLSIMAKEKDQQDEDADPCFTVGKNVNFRFKKNDS